MSTLTELYISTAISLNSMAQGYGYSEEALRNALTDDRHTEEQYAAMLRYLAGNYNSSDFRHLQEVANRYYALARTASHKP